MKIRTTFLAALAGVTLLTAQTAPVQQQEQVVPRHANDRMPRSLTMHAQLPGGCTIQNNNTGNPLAPGVNGDALFKLLSAEERCPENALIFRELVEKSGMKLHPAMVANRGFHNPLPQGSFSFFESVTGAFGGQTLEPGDWFFGHFTAASIDNTALTSILSPQQAATPDNLLLETLVWDPSKGMYNFYEIRGNGMGGVWFYRGDSADILADIRNLHRNTDPSEPIFMGPIVDGQPTLPRLRCSGCHMNGGPIMKELAAPHDSWWTKARPLDLAALRIAPEFKVILESIEPASQFSDSIKKGDAKLLASDRYMKARSAISLPEQLRVVFCEQEVNLASDMEPFGAASPTTIKAPIGFFVDPRLVPDVDGIVIDKAMYTKSLNTFQAQFMDYQTSGSNAVQPINQLDADHAFETPVKAHADIETAARLVSSGVIDEKFLFDVLSVDMTRPMFSEGRCSLMTMLPNAATAGWQKQYQQALAASPSPWARQLAGDMNAPGRTPAWHRKRARMMIDLVQKNAAQQAAVNGYVRLLAGRRISVYQDQVSQHPQGQIFEPGFRLIFPTMQLFQKNQQQIAYGGVPSQFWLNPATGLVELAH